MSLSTLLTVDNILAEFHATREDGVSPSEKVPSVRAAKRARDDARVTHKLIATALC